MAAVARNLAVSVSPWATTGSHEFRVTMRTCKTHWESTFHKKCVERLGERRTQNPDDGDPEQPSNQPDEAPVKNAGDEEMMSIVDLICC